ncbi:hypothetical protein LAZ67_6004030 [Cordylochernes scorpioides]|uniref:Uncharacterized protein n=1 Tax=Cordylochernes scorpioides TaxID=51811 RepID=A0ABY6KP25_9ARAC|nr:hypothetical protein LAZ67_6004030 [Cordylochernes scorpioides]
MYADDPFALSVRYHTVQRRLRQQLEAAEAPKKIEGVLELHLSNEVIREVYIDEIGLPDSRPPPAPPAGDFTFAELNICRWKQAGLTPLHSEEEVFDLCFWNSCLFYRDIWWKLSWIIPTLPKPSEVAVESKD